MRLCEACGQEFTNKDRNTRSCSVKCARILQLRTVGHGPNLKHGYARAGAVEKLHGIWRGILKRCTCPTASQFYRYGGRGIKVCEEWQKDYVAFRLWAYSNGYNESLTIERKDNDGNYDPLNCLWVSRKEQARNRSTTRNITIDGITKCVAAWGEEMGISHYMVVKKFGGDDGKGL